MLIYQKNWKKHVLFIILKLVPETIEFDLFYLQKKKIT